MDDRDRESNSRPIVIVVVIALAAAAWLWFSRPETTQAINESVDVFFPDAESFQQRTSVIDEASRLVDEINSRR